MTPGRRTLFTIVWVAFALAACAHGAPGVGDTAPESPLSASVRATTETLGLVNPSHFANAVGTPADNPNFPDFPQGPLTSNVPHDVDNLFLIQNQNVEVRQRLFDILSWQTFLALAWPLDEEGRARPDLTDSGAPAWTTWKPSAALFRNGGLDPGSWDASAPAPANPCAEGRAQLANLDVISTDRPNLLETATQADAMKLWDQNGNLVYYEILLDQPEFDYIREEGLYSLDGQVSFLLNHTRPYFPTGKYLDSSGQKKSADPALAGVIELKLAWKVIDEERDLAERFYTESACLLNEQGRWEQRLVGLVGMHIAHRTFSAAQWLWATFEQIDNTQVDVLAVQEYADKGQVLRPSFFNPDCQTCPPNTITVRDGISRTQVAPVVEGPTSVQALNQQVQQRLKDVGSVWQYYRLIGTQWPPDPGSGGPPQPVPAVLANPVMETYVPADDASCMNCHYGAAMAATITAQANGGEQVAWGPPGSADFSYLLMKAHAQTLVCSIDAAAAAPVVAELPQAGAEQPIGPQALLPSELRACHVTLSAQATIANLTLGGATVWRIDDEQHGYMIREADGALSIYRDR